MIRGICAGGSLLLMLVSSAALAEAERSTRSTLGITVVVQTKCVITGSALGAGCSPAHTCLLNDANPLAVNNVVTSCSPQGRVSSLGQTPHRGSVISIDF